MDGIVVWRDITKIKKAEKKLRESEQSLEEAQRISHVGSWVWNVKTSELFCSAETFRIYGVEPFSFQPTTNIFLEFVHPEDREHIKGVLADLQVGRTQQIEQEFRIIRKDNSIRHIHSSGEIMEFNSYGKPHLIRGIGQDITERKLLEQQLVNERDFVNAVIQTSGTLISVIDKDGRITRFNKACEKLTGYTADEVKGRSVFDLFVLPEEREGVIRVAKRLFAGESRIDYENHWVTKPGEKRYIRWQNSILLNEKGVPAYAVATGIDITEHLRAQRDLQESERRFRQVVESLPQLVWTCEPDGYCDFLSPQWVHYTGKSESEQLGYRWLEQLHPDDQQRTIDQWQETSSKGEDFIIEFRIRRFDGEYRWFHTLAVPLHDSSGRIVKWFGSNTDIHNIKLAEEELRQSESTLTTILDTLPVGIVTADSKGRLTRINSATRDLWGIPPKTESWEQYGNWIGWWPQTGERIKAEEWALARTLRNGDDIRNELVRNEKFGTHEQRYYLANSVPLRDVEGRISGGVMAMLDITDLRKAEEELQNTKRSLQNTIDSITDGLVVLDKDWHVVDFSKPGAAILGMSLKELIDKNIWDVFPYARNLKFYEFYHRAVEKKQSEHFEEFYPEPINKWIEVHCYPREEGLTVYFRDITDRKNAEAALQESESRFKGIFNYAAMGILVVDTKDHFIAVNNEVCQMLGYSEEEMLTMDVHNLTAPEDRARSDKENEKIHSKEISRVAYEKRYLKADGSRFWANVTVSSIRDEQDRHIGSVTTVEDISKRKKVEQDLRESEASLKRAQEIAHLGSWELDLLQNRLTWSDEIYRIFGLQPQEFGATYEAFLEFVHPDDRSAVDTAYTSSVREGRDSYEIEHRVVRKYTGEIRYVHEKCQHMRDTLGHIIRSLGMVHDITERKQAEEELRESQERFSAAFRTVQDALIISDMKTGRIVDVNGTWVSHWGYSLEETIGHRSTELGVYNNVADRDRALQVMRKEGRLADFEILLRTRSGELRNAILYIEHLMLPRKSLMLTIIHDITERKHAEEQLHQKTEFLENANRDLEKFNRIAVGREMRMIELKKEINSLCIRLGEQPRYSLQFADEGKR